MHNGCLWLGALIPITDMLIHKIAHLPHDGLNLAKEFGIETSERDLVERKKKKFELIKKSDGYSGTSINDPVVKIATQILARNVMWKCRMNNVPVAVISLATQCTKGVQFNWSW